MITDGNDSAKGLRQWRVQIRRKGWPGQTGTFRTKVEAEAWARDVESSMDKGVFVDRSRAHEERLADLIKVYRRAQTACCLARWPSGNIPIVAER